MQRIGFLTLSICWLSAFVGVLLPGATANAQSPENLGELIDRMVLDNLPHQYEDNKRWGLKTLAVRGLSVKADGLKITTKRRRKLVNHGTWRRYQIALVDPKQRFHARILNLGRADDGRVEFDAIFDARLHAHARLSHWYEGVQLISLSTDALADVRLRVHCRIGAAVQAKDWIPELVLKPEVTDADLTLIGYRVTRISKLNGPVVRELGRTLRGVLVRKLEQKEHKLVEKANRQIEKNQDKLRLSIGRAAWSAWSGLKKDEGRSTKD